MFRLFERMVDPYQDYDADLTPPKRLLPFLWAYLRPLKFVLLAMVIFTTTVAIFELILIYYAGRVVDLLSETTPSEVFTTHGVELLLIGVFILLVRPVVSMIDFMLQNQAMLPNVATLIRWRSHRHVLRQSVGWFQNDFAGRIANRIMQTAPAAGEAAYQVFDALVYAVIYMIGALILLGEIDPRLAIPFAIWVVASVSLGAWVVPRIGKASKDFSDARSLITGRIVDSYSNIQSVKLFAHTREEELYAREAIEEARQTFSKQMRLVSLMEAGMQIINALLLVCVVGYAIVLWQNGDASIGTVAAASALTLRLSAMTGWIMWAMSSLFQHLGVISEGMQTIAQDIDLPDAKGAKALQLCDGRISFKDATHHYGKDKGGLHGINIDVAGGQKVGLVGRSGAGKSSLVNLMLRFHDLESGDILIDGQSIREITQDSLRGQIGMVTQDSSLMHRSVRDNILYGRPKASEADMIAAAKHAEAHEFILGLEDPQGRTGYDAHVGERGVKLSGGQRQRIGLARVILKNAPILVLDEATSALDSEVEAAIQDTLYGVMEGKTVIAIAHRLSTIAHMDRILVLDDGALVEDGTHTELIAQDGLYARFWNRQSGGFIGIDE